ncbi:NAD(P)/FAD-dependent oxidoreductase [Nitratireductor mangrovi]|uniref:NADH:ubiquinone reductase (non-electrogenic) n=1 Tax=Nitratireductor mangrovi TaxID=2599600 RepID=A0A5B8L521_9HYPH|nr:NAD(P)/FAD-dependent oxidoreductase [Nitratireductor mangrovi]QDZ02800.1 NAD(P)/FAD-dependent oxidoreductase [Nitratireductor mangrovi]
MWREHSEVAPEALSRVPAARADRAPKRPRVVILGAGFAGLNAAIGLRNAPVDIAVIDQRNHHLFQPLLYQVATAGLSPAQIATPIRRILAKQRNATVYMETVKAVDPSARTVTTCSRTLGWDYLILATGARHAYFGHDEWEAFAPGLKTVGDATAIRARILTAFEKAEASDSETERARLLTFAVVGAGPTGVEMAGAIAELARKAIAADFRNIDATSAKVVLLEAGPRVLPSFPPDLSEKARRQLFGLGVEVRVSEAVAGCDADGVTLQSGERIPAATIIWGAGVVASAAATWISAHSDRAGRVMVAGDLSVPGHLDIYAIGDTANARGPDGRPVPGVAPAAKQMGRYVARHIAARLRGRSLPAFAYRDLGNLATIGRKAAVADFGRARFSGFPAWLVWSFAHLWFLVGFRNRMIVFLDWAWAYATFDRSARLITDQPDARR